MHNVNQDRTNFCTFKRHLAETTEYRNMLYATQKDTKKKLKIVFSEILEEGSL